MGKQKRHVGSMGYQSQRRVGGLYMNSWHNFVPQLYATHRPGKCSLVISMVLVRNPAVWEALILPSAAVISCWHKVWSHACVNALGMPVALWNFKAPSSAVFPSATPHILGLPNCSQHVGTKYSESWALFWDILLKPPYSPTLELSFLNVHGCFALHIYLYTEARRGCWIP